MLAAAGKRDIGRQIPLSAVKAKARRAISPTARAKGQFLHRQQDSGPWLGPWKALLCLAKGRQREFQWPSSRVLSQGQESFPCQSFPPKTRPGASHARSRKILPAEETALRFFRVVCPRNSIEAVSLNRFYGIQPLLPCVFPREHRSTPVAGARSLDNLL